eukprot:8646102-Pyramimonas_sp.AAC.1
MSVSSLTPCGAGLNILHCRMDRTDLIEPSYHWRIQLSHPLFVIYEAICPCGALSAATRLGRGRPNCWHAGRRIVC